MQNALKGVYTVERQIGRGGAARVFAARTPEGQLVALKVLHPELLASVAADRFLREVQLVRRLDHPRIARLLDSGERDWLVYYVMPYIEGPTLKQHLARVRRLPGDDVRRLAAQLLDALAHAHDRGVMHRDVKPDNIMLSGDGVVLLDFGIARAVALSSGDRLTRSGIAVGTSNYMSPEQIAALEDLDSRSDLYSLGCVLFECLAGRPPFVHQQETTVLRMHRLTAPPDLRSLSPDTPADLAAVIARALVKDREARWPSAAAMLAPLRPTLASREGSE